MAKKAKQPVGTIDIVDENTIIANNEEVSYFPDPICNELAKAIGDDEKLFDYIKSEASDLINHCDNANVLLLSTLIKEVRKLRILIEGNLGKLDSNQKSG
jgi:hypothetical protein